MNLDFLQRILAQFLDKFKLSNPVLFVIIASILSAAQYFIQSGTIPLDPKITGAILWFAALFVNSGTFNFKK